MIVYKTRIPDTLVKSRSARLANARLSSVVPAAIAVGALLIGMAMGAPRAAGKDQASMAIAPAATPAPTVDGNAPLHYQSGPHKVKARIEGTIRGRQRDELLVLPLVPDHVGLTIASQPVLYWYLSTATQSKVMFVLVDTRSIEVVHDMTLSPQPQPGVQPVRLKDFGVFLEPNVQYRWYITVVMDPMSPSRDIVSGGMIKRIPPEFELGQAPTTVQIDPVLFYAEHGLWYDALGAVSDRIASAPKNRVLRQQRASLLRQVGLEEAADWDLRQVETDDISR